MSWFFGIISKTEIEKNLTVINSSSPSFLINEGNLLLCGGGNDKTLFSKTEGETKWAAAGTGIKKDNGSYRLMGQNEWENFFNNKARPEELNGHFASVLIEKQKLTLFTDIPGLRDIYLYEDRDKILFTTMPALAARFIPLEINFSEFGGRWLLLNQLSVNSIFKNLERITAGKSVTINLSDFSIYRTAFEWPIGFDKLPSARNKVEDILNSLINFPLSAGNKISLSLSGGMDSRIILSGLINNSKDLWNAHTFGHPGHPDSVISARLAERFGFGFEQVYNAELTDGIIKELSAYSSGTIINAPASAYLQLRSYKYAGTLNNVIIDGGFGEILRREFLNKLLWKCRHAIIGKDAKGIIPHLKLFKTDIFTAEINRIMEEGASVQLDLLLSSLPQADEKNIEDWLDLFSIKTRLPNFYGPEQSRVDGMHINYMPFAQKDFLELIFSIPAGMRKNGRLSKEFIRMHAPTLAGIPLAKGNTTHPFFMGSFQSRLWSYLQRSTNRNLFADNSGYDLLFYLREFILDTAHSADVRNAPYYDYKKIVKLAEDFYSGRNELLSRLDWWLAFELFRKGIIN